MRLIVEESKKLWTQRMVQITLVATLLLSLGMFYEAQIVDRNVNPSHTDYLELKSDFDNYDLTTAIKSLNETVETLSLYVDYSKYVAIPETFVEIRKKYYHKEFHSEQFIFDYQTAIESYDLTSELVLHKQLLTYYISILNYPNYIASSQSIVDQLENQPFWEFFSPSRKEFYSDLKDKYESLKTVKLTSQNTLSIEIPLKTHLEILMIIVGMILFFCAFEIDKSTNMNELLLITKRGRIKTTIAKLLVASLSLFFVLLLVHFILLLLSQSLYGLIDWSSPIQSYPLLYQTPYKQAIFSWYTWVVLGQYVGLLALSLLFACLYQILSNRKQVVVIFFFIIGLGVLFYFSIEDTMSIAFLKYMNVFVVVQARQLYQSFSNFEFIGVAISKITISYIISGILIFASTIIILLVRGSQFKILVPSVLNLDGVQARVVTQLKRFGFEVYKLFIMQKGIFIMIILFVVVGNYYVQFQNVTQAREQDADLVALYEVYGGLINQEKIEQIEARHTFYKGLELNLRTIAQQYQRNEIDQAAYFEAIDAYSIQSEEKRLFEQFYRHYLSNTSEAIIYPNGYQALFSMKTEKRDYQNAVMMMLVLVLVLSPLFSQDRDQDSDGIYRITRNGNKPLTISKITLALIFVISLVVTLFVLDLIAFNVMYHMNAWSSSLSSVLSESIESSKISPWILSLSLWQYAILLLFVRMSAAITAISIILWISSFITSILVSYIVSTFVLFTPVLMTLFDNEIFGSLSIHKMLMGSSAIYDGLGIIGISMVLFAGIIVLTHIIRHSEQS